MSLNRSKYPRDDDVLGLLERTYKDTGFMPAMNTWCDANMKCAGGIGILRLAYPKEFSQHKGGYMDFAAYILGVSVEWAEGFTYGFDDYDISNLPRSLLGTMSADFQEGFRVGKKAKDKFIGAQRFPE